MRSHIVIGALSILALLNGGTAVIMARQATEGQRELAAMTDLLSKKDAAPKTVPLDLQERCAEDARRSFNADWAKSQVGDATALHVDIGYENHFNSELGKCLMSVSIQTVHRDGRTTVSYSLLDANEQRFYGSFLSFDGGAKPFTCKTLPFPDQPQYCQSLDDYKKAAAHYMGQD